MNGSTFVSFSFADSNAALSNYDFFALPDHSIPHKPVSYTNLQKIDMGKAFDEVRTVANTAFVEVEEIGTKVETIGLLIYSLISSCEGSIGDAVRDVPGMNPSSRDIIFSPDDKDLHLVNDIKATFDQVTGLNDATGQMFRLYNAAFARFPDASGLKYWIANFTSGKDDSRAVASSFLVSAEFKQRYGENVSNEKYVETLYLNVLGRDYDQTGYNYWLGNLNNGVETKYELLLGFAESIENKGLFSEMTGFV